MVLKMDRRVLRPFRRLIRYRYRFSLERFWSCIGSWCFLSYNWAFSQYFWPQYGKLWSGQPQTCEINFLWKIWSSKWSRPWVKENCKIRSWLGVYNFCSTTKIMPAKYANKPSRMMQRKSAFRVIWSTILLYKAILVAVWKREMWCSWGVIRRTFSIVIVYSFGPVALYVWCRLIGRNRRMFSKIEKMKVKFQSEVQSKVKQI